MADGREIIFLYRDPNTGEDYYAVLDVALAWHAAGRPPINSAGRLYAAQKYLRDGYINIGPPRFSPADDPDRPDLYPLGHVRFCALDIDPTAERVAALEAAGLVRPFSWEGWHWAPVDPYYYPLVYSIPAGVRSIDDVTAPPIDYAAIATARRRRVEG